MIVQSIVAYAYNGTEIELKTALLDKLFFYATTKKEHHQACRSYAKAS